MSEVDRDPANLPPKPLRPGDGDCCGNDCPLCVFTLYERELERWQAQADTRSSPGRR